MLSFKDVSDIDMIKRFLNKNSIWERFSPKGLFFGAFDDGKLFGTTQIVLEDGKAYIQFVFIDKEYRGQGLGNAMVRSLFNKLEMNGFNMVYSKIEDEYLEKIGFSMDQGEYYCNLEDLFSGGCSCCIGDHHD
ncbi:MAG: GNAT family N-acetyltransferase [Gudongella sp.]|nr:GNAT family N-acetyltransferase [Gudongella sp.]